MLTANDVRQLYPEMASRGAPFFMPSISTQHLPTETASHVRAAYNEVQGEPKVGIIEERYTGQVPITIDRKPPYAGVTEIRQVITQHGLDVEATRMGISDSLPTYQTLPNGRVINAKKRVAKHEARHIKSEKLTKYLDVDSHMGTLIMESYAEFGGMKANPGEKSEILLTTPYEPAIKFGLYADRFYRSAIDGAQGYAAFIKDIQRYKSAQLALANLGRNIRDAVNRGFNPKEEMRSAYNREVRDAFRKAA